MDIDDDDEVYFSNADDDPDFPVVQEYYINNIDSVDDNIVCPVCHTECLFLNAAEFFVQHGICVIDHLSEQQQQPGQAIGQRRIIPHYESRETLRCASMRLVGLQCASMRYLHATWRLRS